MSCDPVGDTNEDAGGREQNEARKSYATWSNHESKELLKLLAEEVNNVGFSKKEKITAFVLPKVNAKFGRNKEYSHVKNKLKNWSRRLEPTKELDFSGIGWDPIKQKFVATDELWEELKKGRIKAASLRHMTFEDYDKLKLVVDHYTRGKDAAVLSKGGTRPSDADRVTPVTDRKKDNVMEIEETTPRTTSPPMDDTPLSISQGPVSAPSSSTVSTQRKRKATTVDSPEEPSHAILEKLAKNVTAVGESLHELTTELNNLNQPDSNMLLEAVDRVVEEMKWRSYEVFTNPTIKEAFIRMPHDERLRFLLFKLKCMIPDQH